MARQRFFLDVIALFLLAWPAGATVIFPGDSFISPDAFNPVPGSLVDIAHSGNMPFSFDGTTGTFQSTLLSDTANPFCTGCLDFALIFNVTDATNSINRASMIYFAGYATDGGYYNGLGGTDPTSMARNGSGGAVGFFYSTAIGPGGQTAVLIIKTNATSYSANGTVFLVDNNSVGFTINGSNSAPIFEPAGPAVPEPSAATLLGLGVAALGVFRRARFTISNRA